jgi:peptide/nickel transport system permease protein
MDHVAVEPRKEAVPTGPATAPASSWLSRHPLVRFLALRLVGAAATLFVVSFLIFLALQIIPGDVARMILGRSATPEAIAELRAQLGLDQPLLNQYLDWIGGVLRGDLGDSATGLAHGSQDPSVWSAISTPLRNSVHLAGVTIVLLIPSGMVLGAWAAVRARRAADHVISVSALTFGAMPEFLVATILVVVFFSWLDVLPPIAPIAPGETPFSHPDALILPVATLLAVCLSFTVRMVRAGTIEALKQDYVAMARLNGVPERRVIWRHALRNALAPSVQAIALTVTYLAGGIIITESVFNYPGIGRSLVQAVSARDVTTVADITLILAAFYVVINLVADFIVVLLVPKLRTSL